VITRVQLIAYAILLAIVATIASCAPTASPSQAVCDGISSEVGGCTAERHKFIGSTCEALGKEWGEVLDRAVVAIIDGPEAVAKQARSVRLRQALVIATADMNTRLQELKLQADCDLPEFMAAAEPTFSEKLRAGVGAALFDGSPATYEDWLEDVRKVARSIDDGE